MNDEKRKKNINDETVDQITNDIYLIVMNGFGKKNNDYGIDFDNVEKKIGIDYKNIIRDKIFDAIASVVAEEGLWDTTISKIAARLEMSKSSLYFYHKNKYDMLHNMIYKEYEMKNALINRELEKFSKFEEILYCFITGNTAYFMYDKRIMLVFDWLHTQKIDMKAYINKNKSILFDNFRMNIGEYAEKGMIDLYHFSIDFIYGFLTMQIVKEMYYADLMKKELALKDMRHVYNFFLKGLNLGGS